MVAKFVNSNKTICLPTRMRVYNKTKISGQATTLGLGSVVFGTAVYHFNTDLFTSDGTAPDATALFPDIFDPQTWFNLFDQAGAENITSSLNLDRDVLDLFILPVSTESDTNNLPVQINQNIGGSESYLLEEGNNFNNNSTVMNIDFAELVEIIGIPFEFDFISSTVNIDDNITVLPVDISKIEIIGTPGDDTGLNALVGTGANDIIRGLAGNDVLIGGLGDDDLFGGEGNDQLYGQDGNDVLYGENGLDFLVGGLGDDVLYGGDGDDHLIGQDGNDVLYGDNGNDIIDGELGDDRLEGGNGNDFLYGRDGNDILNGGDGTDTLLGGEGNDILNGGLGSDLLRGEGGNDIFNDVAFPDLALGGAGSDIINYINTSAVGTLLANGESGTDTLNIASVTNTPWILNINGHQLNYDGAGGFSGSALIPDVDITGNTINLVTTTNGTININAETIAVVSIENIIWA